MDHNRDSSLFLKFIESKCTNIKTNIDSLLAELCNQLSHSNHPVLQPQGYTLCRDTALSESNAAGQTRPVESGRSDRTDAVPVQRRRKALVGRGGFDAGQHCSAAVKKEAVANHSSDYQQYESAHLQVQSVYNQHTNARPKKIPTKPLIKEKDSVQIDTHNVISEKSRCDIKEQNQDFLEQLKSIENLDFDPTHLKSIIYVKDRNCLRFKKNQLNKEQAKYFKIKNSNLETNLFILNHIQKLFLDQLSTNKSDYEIFLADVNKKQNYTSNEI